MATEYDLKQEMASHYKESQSLFQQYWYQADQDLKMTVGQQNYWNQLLGINSKNQRLLQFNKCLRIMNLIGGYQRKNRNVSICVPRENSDQQTADQLSGLLMWAMSQDGTYEKISENFESSISTGFNLMRVWMDFRDDSKNGDIRTTRVHYNQFLMDPYWREMDLSDCNWIWQRTYMKKEAIKAILPDKYDSEIDKMKKIDKHRDGKFLYMPENRQPYNADFLSYDEYWKKEFEPTKKLLDKKTGDVSDLPRKMDNERLKFFLKMNPDVQIITVKKPTVRLYVVVNDQLIYEEQAPYGIDSFPYVPFICYHFPDTNDYSYRYQGVIRNVRDSQIELNHRRNKMLDIIDSQINSGLIVKEDALVDPEDAFMAGQGRALFVKETANIADVQPIPAPNLPPGMFELQKILDDEIMNISGVTEELFGEADGRDTSGIMIQLRMGAGLVSLQTIFDRLRLSQKMLGELFIEMIQANFSAGKVRRILNEEPTPQFKDQEFQKYDCVIEEGLLTSTQRQLQFAQLLHLRELGIPISSEILLETSTLQNKNKLIEDIKQKEEQQAKIQQQQIQQQMYHQALLTRSVEAKAQNDFAAAQERQGRTISNIGLYAERESEQIKNMAAAALNNARAMAEIAGLEDDRVIKLANFILQLQREQQLQQANVDIKGVQAAEFVGEDVDIAKQKTKLPETEKPPQEISRDEEIPLEFRG